MDIRMTRRLPLLVGFILILALLAACSSEPPVRVLFVGNSYTATNDLPGMVRSLADSVGTNLEVEAHAPGGWWLRDHIASTDTLDAIAKGEFDFVVLQEQSMVPAAQDLSERESRPAAVGLATRAVQTGASVIFFMTWGHRNGSADVGHSSYESMQIAIANTFDRFASATASEAAPVGAAWWMSLAERPDITLYQADGSHPSPSGTYLAAAVIAGNLLDVDPTEFDDDRGLDANQAEAIREFASRAVGGERPWG